MAHVGDSWVRVHCETCGERRTFFLREKWVVECGECGARKDLRFRALFREERAAPRSRARSLLSFALPVAWA
jgi:hypothetical protein